MTNTIPIVFEQSELIDRPTYWMVLAMVIKVKIAKAFLLKNFQSIVLFVLVLSIMLLCLNFYRRMVSQSTFATEERYGEAM